MTTEDRNLMEPMAIKSMANMLKFAELAYRRLHGKDAEKHIAPTKSMLMSVAMKGKCSLAMAVIVMLNVDNQDGKLSCQRVCEVYTAASMIVEEQRTEVRNLIERVAFLLSEGKIDGGEAFKLMRAIASLNGDIQREEAQAFANEKYITHDNIRMRKTKESTNGD